MTLKLLWYKNTVKPCCVDYKSVTNTYQGLRFEQTIEWNSKKGYGCKWKWETIQFYTWTQIKVKEQLLVRKDMDVNEHEKLTNITLKYKIKVKEQLVVRNDIDVNEHERLTNITLRYKIRVKEQLVEWNDMDVNKHERLTNITLRYKIK